MSEGDMFREDLIWENDVLSFYRNDWCLIYESHINEYDEKGITLPDRMTVYLCVAKDDGHRSYVAFDSKNISYLEWTDSFDFDIKLKMVKMDIAESNDIVNLAKKRKDEKNDM